MPRLAEKSQRTSRGQHLVELLAGLIVLIPVFLFIFDIVVIFMAKNVNDTACRDAARAASAASIDPANPTKSVKTIAEERAKLVIDQFSKRGDNPLLKGPQLKSFEIADYQEPDAFGGEFRGTVRVSTEVELTLPATLPGLPQTQNLQSAASFPLTATSTGALVIP